MEKRVVLAVVLCVGILFAWQRFFAPPPLPPSARTGGAAAPATPVAAAPAAAPQARGPERLITLDTPEVKYVLSSAGGVLRQAQLKGRKFLDKAGDNDSGLRLVRTHTVETAPLQVRFGKADFDLGADLAWSAEQPAPGVAVFRAETDAVAIEKRYEAEAANYRLKLDVTVSNKTAKSQRHNLAIYVYGAQDPEHKGGGMFSYATANPAELVCAVGDKIERSGIESAFKDPKDAVGAVRWIAADEKYFTIAVVPPVAGSAPNGAEGDRRCAWRGLDTLTGEVSVALAPREVPAGQSTHYTFDVFAGPKYREALNAVRPGGVDVELDKLVNVTLAVLSRPMLALLKIFHRFVGNWGVAIILLTVFVRLVTFYPAHRALMSGKRMARLQPQLQALRKKYENDKERLARETMALYKDNGVNMLGGCLPSLIQMPIWIALYSTLNYAVELYRSSFFGYITDLSARDKYFITPLLMGCVMVIQMRMSPAGADPQQQKIMSVMMPVMFTAFSLFLPSGLAIYTLTSYTLGILHQILVNRLDQRAAGGPLKPVRAKA